jgi:hypothetical protein
MSHRNASPLAALQQAERLLAARLGELAGELTGASTRWVEYADLARALATVMGHTRGWQLQGPYRRTGPRP